MSAVRDKLRGKNGASIFMGLMFLLVCLVVGTIVLTASTAASGKLARLRESEQDYLTVASAARLLKDRICALTYTHVYAERSVDGDPPTTVSNTPTLTASGGEVILEDELLKLCGTLPSHPVTGSSPVGSAFTVSATSSPASDWKIVYGKISIKRDGRLLVKLWLGDAEENKPENHNQIELEFCPDGPLESTVVKSVEHESFDDSADLSTGTTTITTTTTVTTTCTWPEDGCIITRGTA